LSGFGKGAAPKRWSRVEEPPAAFLIEEKQLDSLRQYRYDTHDSDLPVAVHTMQMLFHL